MAGWDESADILVIAVGFETNSHSGSFSSGRGRQVWPGAPWATTMVISSESESKLRSEEGVAARDSASVPGFRVSPFLDS